MSDAVREAIRLFRDGEIVVVTDDDDRENEGDLVCAASLCTPEKMPVSSGTPPASFTFR